MKGYAVICGVAVIVTLLFTPLVRRFAIRFGAVVSPSAPARRDTRLA